jgi:hypothetical protein
MTMCLERKKKHNFQTDATIKLNYIRTQSKLLGFGNKIYRSNRRCFKYVIWIALDDGSEKPINFGESMTKDYLDTGDVKTKNLWHMMNQDFPEYYDNLDGLFYEAKLLY